MEPDNNKENTSNIPTSTENATNKFDPPGQQEVYNQAPQLTFKPPQANFTSHETTDIYNAIYRPQTRLTSIQMNGTKKVADPVTGIYRIYSDAPANRPQAPKPNLSSLSGTSGLSDANGLTKPILNMDANRQVRNMTDLKPKSNLKRTLSIPNIKSLDKDMAMANLLSDTSSSGNYFGHFFT